MLTAKDMQDLLQVDRSTIYRMAESGRLPAVKVGKQWRFPNDQVDDWLKDRSQVAGYAPTAQVVQEVQGNKSTALKDLLPIPCVQLIQDTFAEALGVMVVVTDMDGQPITEVSNPCGLFEAISQKPNAVQKCIDGWHRLAMTVELEPKFGPNHLGMLCARGLIRQGLELKGMVMVGGVAPKNWPPLLERIEMMAEETEVETELLSAHIDEVYYLTDQDQARVLPFVQKLADIVAHIATERHSLMDQLSNLNPK